MPTIIIIERRLDKHWWINCGVLLVALLLAVALMTVGNYYLVEEFRILVDAWLGG